MSGASDTVAPGRGGVRIVVWLLFGAAAVVALLSLLAALTLTGIRASNDEILRAEQSVRQMQNVQRVEAAFNAYLLHEVRRRLNGDEDLGEAEAAGRLRGALIAYRRQLAVEIAAARSDAERDEERGGVVRAGVLAEIFETVERESLMDRRAADGSLRGFLGLVAAGREDVFLKVAAEALADERAEVERAFANLAALRGRLVNVGGAVAAAFTLALIAFGVLFYRGLMRPIRLLTAAVEGAPEAGRRAPEGMPGEFAMLADRFNAMVSRTGSERAELQGEVAARTADLEAANRRLTEVDRTRREFFANISHELRTPLTVLLGEAQIALRDEDEDGAEARAALERIAASGGYLRRRMDDLMRLARSEDGALTLTKAPFDLGEAVAGAVQTVRGFGRSKGVDVAFVDGPPRRVTGDREAMQQAALALLDNAIKFTPSGGAVRAVVSATGFEVRDGGPGFGDVDATALFDRYAQAKAGRARGGSGLGLAIVKWIADQHGATLRLGDWAGGDGGEGEGGEGEGGESEGGGVASMEFGT